MKTRNGILRLSLLSSVAIAALSSVALAQGLPTGGAVQAGRANIGAPTNGSLTVNQSSQRAVINWQNFNVGAGNSVTFQQPGANAATLNRVTGANASNVAGSIQANGKVYLVNPNGVQITPTGKVDAKGGFVASTLGITTQDFMAGKDKFTGNGHSAAVTNQGAISTGPGGDVALIGGSVSNEGTITAPLGKVALGAGEAATLDVNGDGFLQVTVPSDATDASGKPLVSNSGKIDAAGGTVELKAATVQGAMRNAVNMSGSISANSVTDHDGVVVLGTGEGNTTVSGTVDVSGADHGGRIDITGNSVNLQGATLNASGDNQGGLVRVGGPFQGGRPQDPASDQAQKYVERFNAPALATADNTTVDANTKIDVSASGAAGMGGTAIIWSNQNTVELGAINARGVAGAGAVEVSSQNAVQSVNFGGIVLGEGGSLLLDPKNINIIDDPNDGSVAFDALATNAALANAYGYAFADGIGGTVTLSGQAIMNVLQAGTDVTLQASNNINWTFYGVGAISSGGPIGHLTLQAGNSVTISGQQMTLDAGHLTIIANDTHADGVVNADRDSGTANLDISGAFLEGDWAYGANTSFQSFLTLKLLTGAGNTNHAAGAIKVNQPDFSDVVIDAEAGETQFFNQVFLANNLTLTGNVHTVNNNPNPNTINQTGLEITNTFTWTDFYTAKIVTDNTAGTTFAIFDANNFYYAWLNYNATDAVRLDMGSATAATDTYTSVYGSAAPTAAQLNAAHQQWYVDPHSAIQTLPDAASSIVRSNAFTVNGPAATTPVGNSTITLVSGSGGPIRNNLTGSYLIKEPNAGVSYQLTITPRPVTVTAVGDSYVYGSPSGNADVTLSQNGTNSGVVNGDAVIPVASVSGIAGGQTMVDVSGGNYGFGFAQYLAGGTHTYTVTSLTGAAAGNYKIDTATSTATAQTLTISPALLIPTVTAGSYTYGTPGDVVTLAGILNNDVVAPVATISGLSGSQTLLNDAGSYAFDAHVAAGSRTYTLTGLSGLNAANYTLDLSGTISSTLSIAQKSISYTSCCSITSTYGTAATPNLALSGTLSGDDVSGNVTVTGVGGGTVVLAAKTPVGSYTIATNGLSGAQGGNYTLTGSTSFTLTVNPLALSYSGPSGTVSYGTAFGGAVSLNGVLPGDTVSAALGISSGGGATVDYTNHADAGTYQTRPGTLSGASASNYTIASSGNAPGTLTINPVTLTYSLSNLSVTYGNGLSLGTVLTGVLFNDDVSPTLTTNAPGGAITANTAVGTYNASVSGLTGAKAGDYTLGSGNAGATITVNARTLTYATVATSTIYGDQAHAPNASVIFTGYANGLDQGAIHPVLTITDGQGNVVAAASTDNTSFLGETIATMANNLNAGAYTVGVGFSSNDANHPTSNYVIAGSGNTDHNITVAKAPLNATLTSPSLLGLVYGSVYQIGANVGFTGFAPGEFGTGRLSLTDSSNNSVALAAPCCGAGSPGGLVAAGTDVGSYSVAITSFDPLGAANPANYYIASTTTTPLSIVPKTLHYSAGSVSSVYGALASLSGSLSGIYSTDDVTVGNVTATPTAGVILPVTLTATTNAGSYTTAVTSIVGAKAFDYVLASSGNTNGTLTIAPKPITWSVADTSATYSQVSGTAALGAVTLSGIINNDDVNGTVAVFAHNSSVFSMGASFVPGVSTNVGTYPTYVTGLTGGKAGNYVINTDLTLAHPGTFTINPYAVTLQISSVDLTYLDAYAPSLTGQVPNFAGTGTFQIGYNVPLISDVGTYTVTGVAFYSTNYNITVLPGIVTVRPLVVTYNTTAISTIQNPTTTTWVYGSVSDADLATLVNGMHSFVSLTGANGQNFNSLPFSVAPYYYAGSPVLPLNQHTDVGTYPVLVALTSPSPNYTLQAGSIGSITITPRSVTINSSTSVYGSSPSFTVSNAVAGDDVSLPTGFVTITGTTGAAYNLVNRWNADGSVFGQAPPVDSYSIQGTLAGAKSNNYVIANEGAATLAIMPKPISITALMPVSAVYGSQPGITDSSGQIVYQPNYDPTFVTGTGVKYSGLVYGGDGLLLQPYMTALGVHDVGTYSWAVTGSKLAYVANGVVYSCTTPGCVNLNYVLTGTAPSATVTVTPKPITYSIAPATTTYGTAVPLDVTFQGLLTKDLGNFSAALNISQDGVVQAVNGETTSNGQGSYSGILGLAPAGTYALTLQAVAGTAVKNYQLPAVTPQNPAPSAALVVNPKPITYYTYAATLYEFVGAIGGSLDDFGKYDLSGVLQQDAANVGLNLGVQITGTTINPISRLDIGQQPGQYAIVPDGPLVGSAASNYVIASNGNFSGLLTVIDPRILDQLSFGGQQAGTDLIKLAQQQRQNLQTAVINSENNTAATPNTNSGGTGAVDVSLTDDTEGGGDESDTGSNAPTGIHTGTSTSNGDPENTVNEDALSKSMDWQVFPTDTTGFSGNATVQVCDTVCEQGSVTYNDAGSASYSHVALQEQIGVSLNIAAQQNCGSGQCAEQFKEEAWVGEDASITAVMNANGFALGAGGVAGAGVGVGVDTSYSDDYGAVDLYAGVTIDKWGASGQLGVELNNGYLQFDIGAEFDAGIGVDLDLKFDVNIGVLTGYYTYVTTFTNPGLAEARENLGLYYVQKAQQLEESEQYDIQQFLKGDFNNNPQGLYDMIYGSPTHVGDPGPPYANGYIYQENALMAAANRNGFDISPQPDGTWSYIDKQPPAYTTTSTYHAGAFDDVKNWVDGVGDDIKNVFNF